ncbi:MAG: spore germination protein GerW family protein [Candidatus Margulisiibacteriota bacterium]
MKKGLKKRKHTDIHEVLKEVSDNIEKTANVKTVFGDPVRVGHRTIIPVATVSVMGGGGGGFAKEGKEKAKAKKNDSSGVGGGLGLRVESKPVGYIEITDEGAKFVPTVDQTKIALRGLLSGLVAIGMFSLSSIIKAFRKEKKAK